MDNPTCVLVEDGSVCGRPVYIKKRGWCKKHYKRWQRHRDPLKLLCGGDPRVRVESLIDRSGGPDACHPWRGAVRIDGYGNVLVGNERKLAHIAAWEFENGPRPPGIQLDHECHNQALRDSLCKPGICPHRLCCNLRHIVVRADNAEHMRATPGRSMRRRGNSNAKLTEEQVREICALLAAARGRREVSEIAQRYSISAGHAYRIKRGGAWGWLAA